MATQTIIAGDTSFDAVGAGDTFYVLAGGQSITGNVDGSGQNTSVTAEISRAFTGQIGTAGAPWKTAFSTRLVYAAGAGDLYFFCVAADPTTTSALVQSIGGGHLHWQSGTATRLEQLGGIVTVENGGAATTARCAGGSMNLLDTGTGGTCATVDILGGNVYTQRPHTTVNVGSGSLTLDSDDAGGVNAIGTALNIYGGVVNLVDYGTIAAFNWYGGDVNAAGLARPITFTASTINMSRPGAQALLNNPLITFSSNTRIITDGR